MYSNLKKNKTDLGKGKTQFSCVVFLNVVLIFEVTFLALSLPVYFPGKMVTAQNAHEHTCQRKRQRARERETEADDRSQGLRQAARTPVSPAGSHLTWVPFSSEVKPQALPST